MGRVGFYNTYVSDFSFLLFDCLGSLLPLPFNPSLTFSLPLLHFYKGGERHSEYSTYIDMHIHMDM